MNHTVELFPSVPVTPTTRKEREGLIEELRGKGGQGGAGVLHADIGDPFCRFFQGELVSHGRRAPGHRVINEPVAVRVQAVHGHEEEAGLDVARIVGDVRERACPCPRGSPAQARRDNVTKALSPAWARCYPGLGRGACRAPDAAPFDHGN